MLVFGYLWDIQAKDTGDSHNGWLFLTQENPVVKDKCKTGSNESRIDEKH